jgi:peptidoglycan glycosyltransferase
MAEELNRVTLVALVAFLVIALSAAFWSVIQAGSMLARSDNARNVIAQQRIQRGAIYDRDGNRLAYSQESRAGIMQRIYPYPEAAGAVGYYSLTYGTTGIEEAFNQQLDGNDLLTAWKTFVDNALHRPQQGSDVRSTIDLEVQLAAANEMDGRAGAVVVVDVPSGRVLAMVSEPGYDPNTLDANWNALTRNEQTSPLLNRVTAGLYQPGGTLETVLLAELLSTSLNQPSATAPSLTDQMPDAHDPVPVNGLTLVCLPGTPDQPLTLAEAYDYGCPAPFASAINGALTPERVWERLKVLGLLDAPILAGFQTAVGGPPAPFTAQTPPVQLQAELSGQGDLTVTPLQMVQVLAAVSNDGNSVPLHVVDAVRRPGAKDWQAVELPALQPALMQVDVADALRMAMRQAAEQSPEVSRAARPGLTLYGHSAQSFGGPNRTPYVWFTGFIDHVQGDQAGAIVAVVVVENESDPGVAAEVAGRVFQAAASDEE